MFEFAWPWLWLLLPLPLLVRRLSTAQRQSGSELRVPFYPQLDALQHSQHQALTYWRKQSIVYTLIWLLLLCASARPQLYDTTQQHPQSGRDLLIAIDASNSMAYADMTLDGNSLARIDFVKYWLKNFIAQRQGDRLGLILFGSQAYLQAPLTYDHHSVQTWIQEVLPGIAGDTTAIGDAIGLAIKRLRERPAQQRILLLITDGANNSGVMSPQAAAQLAARYQIKIYTIGIGSRSTDKGQAMFDTSSLELDEPALMEIAQTTAGQYFYVSNSHDFVELLATLNRLEPSTTGQTQNQPNQELYSWPLAAAFLLSLLLAAYPVQRHLRLRQESQ